VGSELFRERTKVKAACILNLGIKVVSDHIHTLDTPPSIPTICEDGLDPELFWIWQSKESLFRYCIRTEIQELEQNVITP
jgi:hypothetical protein